jgi:sporulation protein YlmC with PRC-barrel domain
MSEHHLEFVRQVLDRQIVDSNHILCGKVDDLEIELQNGVRVTALLTGNGAAAARLPELLRVISETFFGKRITRIPWSDIRVIKDVIQLDRTAEEFGLDERHGLLFRAISKLPGAWKK